MLFIILTVVAIAAGFVLQELIDNIYLPICLYPWGFECLKYGDSVFIEDFRQYMNVPE